jgi:predicted Zn-dependent protease
MSDAREQQFRQMVQDFPDSPMGHFSLGKLLLDQKRYPEAAPVLARAVELDPAYAAAMVALADALSGAGDKEAARQVLTRAKETALAQSHQTMAEEIDERLSDL